MRGRRGAAAAACGAGADRRNEDEDLMMSITNYSIAVRIGVGFGLMALMSLALGLGSWWALGLATGLPAATMETLATMRWVIAGLAAGTVVLGGALALLLRNSVQGPIETVVHAVSRVAGGDLESKFVSQGRDEIAWLNSELNKMRKKLREALVVAAQSADSVRHCAEDIAKGSSDLSERTENQAATLQQTAGSMDTLTEAVRANAEEAVRANDLVESASGVASRGGQLMQDMVVRMDDINHSAAKISEIIGVIDGIAFQTNILALNAAVEAARAGEHGRGFAVVAAEVRSLAQRCAAAAKDIKTLIVNSVEKTESGAKLVHEAGTTMQELLASVSQASGLIAGIAQASRQQSQSLAEVNRSIAQVDTTTQQNAALVEQTAAAAGSLKDQSDRLADTIRKFKLA
jgi:methyl-accepting chemotaxis protein